MKIYAQRNCTLTQGELYELAGLLIKAGYTVRIGKAKVGEKYVKAVEYTGADGKEITE